MKVVEDIRPLDERYYISEADRIPHEYTGSPGKGVNEGNYGSDQEHIDCRQCPRHCLNRDPSKPTNITKKTSLKKTALERDSDESDKPHNEKTNTNERLPI